MEKKMRPQVGILLDDGRTIHLASKGYDGAQQLAAGVPLSDLDLTCIDAAIILLLLAMEMHEDEDLLRLAQMYGQAGEIMLELEGDSH